MIFAVTHMHMSSDINKRGAVDPLPRLLQALTLAVHYTGPAVN